MANNYQIGPRGPYSGISPNNLGPNGAAIYLPHRTNPAVTIHNSGAKTVYLDNVDPIGGSSAGQPLSAGSSIGWDAESALYATTATGDVTTLVITENSGSIFDSGAIATAIIDQGLAQDIADAISITGAPPIDKFRSLFESPWAGTSNHYESPTIDTSAWSSVTIAWTNRATLTNGKITVTWYAPSRDPEAPDIVVAREAFYVGIGTDVATTFSTPVKGASMDITAHGTAGSGFFGVFGSYKALAKSTYICDGPGPPAGTTADGDVHAGIQSWAGNLANDGVPLTWTPGVIAGPTRLSLRLTTNGTLTMALHCPSVPNTTMVAERTLTIVGAGGQMLYYDVDAPPGPLALTITNTAASPASLTFRALLISHNPY